MTLRHEGPLGVIAATEAKVLNGRPNGAQLFDKIVKEIEQFRPECIVDLSFAGVEFLDFSCADEFLGKILGRIRSGELEGKFILIQDASDTVLENIGMALKERDYCCPVRDNAGRVQVTGKISAPLLQTYRFALERRTVTTGDVQEHFRLATSAASNRLVALSRMGLVYKIKEGPSEHGGRQYVYEAVG